MRDRHLLIGSLTVLAAACGFALLGPLARFSYDAGLDPFSLVAWRALFGTLVVAAYAAIRIHRGRPFVPPWRLPQRQAAFRTVAVARSITRIPSVLFLTGIRSIGGTRTGILMLFEPVVGVLLAAAWLDESLRPIQILGGVAILGAALLLQRSSRTPEPLAIGRETPAAVSDDVPDVAGLRREA